jgi:hypothetical protein
MILWSATGLFAALNITVLGLRWFSKAHSRKLPELAFKTKELPLAPVWNKPKKKREPLALSFMGPFSYQKQLIEKPVQDSWIAISGVYFSSFTADDCALQIMYGRPEEQNPPCKMHCSITITDGNGKTYTLSDETQWAPSGSNAGFVAGSIAGESNLMLLPIRLNEVAKVDMRFIPQETF